MTPRKELTPAALRGRRPAVRVYEEGGRVKVQWSEAGLRTYRTYGATAAGRSEARRFAVGVYDRLTAPRVLSRLTTRHLWVRYTESAFATLRPRTQQLYASRWRRWELFIGATTIAEDVPTEAVARFASELRKKHPVTQVMGFVRVVKIVYNWGDQLEVLQRNRIGRYRFKRGKDEQVNDPPEYRTPDWEAILRALGGGQEGRQWKAWAAVMLAGSQGERINAALHLQWADVDWAGGRICWRAATNKQGRERWQPMTYEAYAASLDDITFHPHLPTRHRDSRCHIRGNSPNTPQKPSRTLPQIRHTTVPGRPSGSRAFQAKAHQPAKAKKTNCHQGKLRPANGLRRYGGWPNFPRGWRVWPILT